MKTTAYIVILVIIILASLVFISTRSVKKIEKSLGSKVVPAHTAAVKTGDLLLFKYKSSNLLFKATSLFGKSPIHHVGIVYVDANTQHPYVIEMLHVGCRVTSFHGLVKSFPGVIYLRRLSRALSHQENLDFVSFIKLHWSDRYDFNLPIYWFNRLVPVLAVPLESFVKPGSYNCCKFVYEHYVAAGVLDDVLDSNILLPSDFSSGAATKLPCRRGMVFDMEELLQL